MVKSAAKKLFAAKAESHLQFVGKCEEGEHYVYPGVGPVLCKGVDILTLSGIGHVETITFEETHARNPQTRRLTDLKLHSAGIRKLADAATIDKVVSVLESADGKPHMPVANSKRQAFYTDWLNTPDVLQLADLVAKTLGSDAGAQSGFIGRPALGTEFGNKAITLLAREYALVKGVDVEEAARFLTEKSGRNRLIIAAQEREAAQNDVNDKPAPLSP